MEGGAGCVEGDVGAVEWCGVLVSWLEWDGAGAGGSGRGDEELLGKGAETGDFEDEGGEGVA